MSLNVPEPVATYLAAEKAKDVDMLAKCFAADAVVHDEGREHRGIAAIQRWKREADTKYQFVMEPLSASAADDVVTVRARVSGNFPGSPVELNFNFTVADEKIVALKVVP